jgi:hypothetical protein
MTSIRRSDGVMIRRVRITSRLADPTAAQRRIALLLGSADMRQSRLPPSAILCVRKMRDPLPQTKWLDPARSNLPREWEEAACMQLNRLAAGAALPGRGPVAPSAAAVVFLDQADLLACIARDWLEGTAHDKWWWLLLLSSVDPAAAVIPEWERSAEYIPAAVEILQHSGHAAAFMRKLPDRDAARLLSGMLQAHGLVNFDAPGPSSSAADERFSLSTGVDLVSLPPAEAESPGEPWLACIPEAVAAAGLSPKARMLFACALLLRRQPQLARSPGFPRQLESWGNCRNAPAPLESQPGSSGGITSRQPTTISAPSDPSGGPAHARQYPSMAGEAVEAPAPPAALAPQAPRAAQNSPSCEPPPDGAAAGQPLNVTRSRDSRTAESTSVPDAHPAPAPLAHGKEESPPILEPTGVSVDFRGEIDTDFGGAFFLLNVALHLGLYGDFANPLHPALELNIWDFVALFAHKFAGGAFRSDALWRCLAELAGRSAAEEPGTGFNPPDAWRIPLDWLNDFPETGPVRAAYTSDRLVLTHAASFCIADVPLAARALPQALAEEIQPYSSAVSSAVSSCAKHTGMTDRSPLARWTDCVAGYLFTRLAWALGSAGGAALLCRVPARLRTTPTHVHVFIRLEEYPIEIRLAGLDRDPGWIPAAGRYVSFHFD